MRSPNVSWNKREIAAATGDYLFAEAFSELARIGDPRLVRAFAEAGKPFGTPLPAETLTEIESAIKFSNFGGVYAGRSVPDGAPVVIKEARPLVCGPSGQSAADSLRKEYRLLTLLSNMLTDLNLTDIQDVLRYSATASGDNQMGVLQPATGFTPRKS